MKSISVLITLALTLSAAFASAGETTEGRISSLLEDKHCAETGPDPLVAVRSEIDQLSATKQARKALSENFKTWLAQERKSGKDVPTLNWIRMINPWLLPSDFPTKPGFEECAASLKYYSDMREAKDKTATAAALKEWKGCVDHAFAGTLPPEFTQLKNCLAGKP
jgi:hypothetical protein